MRPNLWIFAAFACHSVVNCCAKWAIRAAVLGWVLGWIHSTASLRAAGFNELSGYRSYSLIVPKSGSPGFTKLSSTVTGVLFSNQLASARGLTNSIFHNGSGVAAGDVDGDGWCDFYVCNLDGSNALYRNVGRWRFQDITLSANVACEGMASTGAALVDLDGDGDLDLAVNSVDAGTRLFFNDGRGRFQGGPQVLNYGRGGMTFGIGDLDGDQYLDLYITNYRTDALRDMPDTEFRFRKVDGQQVIATVNGRSVAEPDLTNRYVITAVGGIDEQGQSDAIYRNQGGMRFAELSFTGGAFLDEDGQPLRSPPFDWGLSVMVRDLNGDRRPDIYVCNDFYAPDRIWINQGQGRFRALPKLALRQTSLYSMGVDVADLNRDGWDDIFVLDMLSRDHARRMNFLGDSLATWPVPGEIDNRPQFSRNTLFLNRGDGTYAELACFAGLEAADWAWTPIFLDVDLDGWEDLLVSNGHEQDSRNIDVTDQLRSMRGSRKMSPAEILRARATFPRLDVANLAFRNRGDLTFEEVSHAWGFDFVGVSHGMALADLDNDGDLDVIVNNLNAPLGLYRNNTVAPRLAVRLKGRAPNTSGIGARIKVTGGPVSQSQNVLCGGRYLSSDQPCRVFAAGSATNELTIEVNWPDGRRSLVTAARANRLYEINQSGALEIGRLASVDLTSSHHAIDFQFEDQTSQLHHTHHETSFHDLDRQPLLSRQLSQLGPGVTWWDLNHDGWEDLIIPSGQGGRLAMLQNDRHGGFQSQAGSPFSESVTRDQTTVLPWITAEGVELLVGSSLYEDGLPLGACARTYDLARGELVDQLPPLESSVGPLALVDLNGDGELELFVGGRCLPGRYPIPASSALFRRRAGHWELDQENSRTLKEVGLVSGAVFSDLDGDGFSELILACDWGPIKVFHNQRGILTEVTEKWGMLPYTGWWNGVATGDFDGDGRLDLVASNWGRNTSDQSRRARPLRLYYGDLDQNGTIELIPAAFDPGLNKIVPIARLEDLRQAWPLVQQRCASYAQFGTMSVEDLLGPDLRALPYREAAYLESMLWLNRGDHFESHRLPDSAQWAPAFGVNVGDFNGDGFEDLFLSQNFFALPPHTPRYDAGRGLLLRGDGQGGFAAVEGAQSGIKVYGEQRGSALADFDHDGRLDLAVAQNGAATCLYRNIAARPGLRVRCQGDSGNPWGVGAVVQLGNGMQWGPSREIHAGAGYWSVDSPVLVLARRDGWNKIRVRWPGGKVTETEVPDGISDLVVSESTGRIAGSR